MDVPETLSVQRHLGLPLVFPGDLSAWEVPQENSSAMLNGYLAEWAVLTEGAINQSFNATDASPFTWGKFWPQVAQWYGLDYLPPSMKDGDYKQVDSKYKTPPRGFGPAGRLRGTFLFSGRARQPEIQKAWTEIAHAHKLTADKLVDVDRVFGFLDASLYAIPQMLSTNKLRKMGRFGTVDSVESYRATLEEFVTLKMLPPIDILPLP